jgi:hypothetical protein
MKLYVAVTADEYELPLYVETSASALARILGIKKDNLFRSIQKHRRTKTASGEFVRIERVVCEDED